MIVRPAGSDALLITQPDHAHLAGRIMEQCVPLQARARRAAILEAIAEHDNGWIEEDAAPQVDAATGAVVDFVNAPLDVRHRVWTRGVARLAHHPWTAALVAQHALTVYDRFKDDAAWGPFFADLASTRDRLLRQAALGLDELLPDYAFVRLGDLVSLVFCSGWAEERYQQWTVTLSGETVTVTPDLFDGRQVPLAVTARQVPSRRWPAAAELARALSQSPPVTLRGVATGG